MSKVATRPKHGRADRSIRSATASNTEENSCWLTVFHSIQNIINEAIGRVHELHIYRLSTLLQSSCNSSEQDKAALTLSSGTADLTFGCDERGADRRQMAVVLRPGPAAPQQWNAVAMERRSWWCCASAEHQLGFGKLPSSLSREQARLLLNEASNSPTSRPSFFPLMNSHQIPKPQTAWHFRTTFFRKDISIIHS